MLFIVYTVDTSFVQTYSRMTAALVPSLLSVDDACDSVKLKAANKGMRKNLIG